MNSYFKLININMKCLTVSSRQAFILFNHNFVFFFQPFKKFTSSVSAYHKLFLINYFTFIVAIRTAPHHGFYNFLTRIDSISKFFCHFVGKIIYASGVLSPHFEKTEARGLLPDQSN
jgi:hypothetical protein